MNNQKPGFTPVQMPKATAAKYGKPPVYTGVIKRFPLALMEIARVSQFGAVKHQNTPGDTSYLRMPEAYDTYSNALARHLCEEQVHGRVNEEDGGMLHAAQAAWDALARLEKLLRNLQVPVVVKETGKLEPASATPEETWR